MLPWCCWSARLARRKTVVPVLNSLARSIDQHVFPVVELLTSSYRDAIQTAGFGALSVTFLGLLALLLACAGMFGLTLFVVSQRTKEIGIRMALGARPNQVLSIVLRQFAKPVIAGLVTGLAARPLVASLAPRAIRCQPLRSNRLSGLPGFLCGCCVSCRAYPRQARLANQPNPSVALRLERFRQALRPVRTRQRRIKQTKILGLPAHRRVNSRPSARMIEENHLLPGAGSILRYSPSSRSTSASPSGCRAAFKP